MVSNKGNVAKSQEAGFLGKQRNIDHTTAQVLREFAKPVSFLDHNKTPTGWAEYEIKGPGGSPTGNYALIHPTEDRIVVFDKGYPRAAAEAHSYAIDNPVNTKKESKRKNSNKK